MPRKCTECDEEMTQETRRKPTGYIAKETLRTVKERQLDIRRHIERIETLVKSGAGNSNVLTDDLRAIERIAWQNELDITNMLNFGRSDEQ